MNIWIQSRHCKSFEKLYKSIYESANSNYRVCMVNFKNENFEKYIFDESLNVTWLFIQSQAQIIRLTLLFSFQFHEDIH